MQMADPMVLCQPHNPTNHCTVDVSTLLDITAIAAVPIARFEVVVVVAVTVALVLGAATRAFAAGGIGILIVWIFAFALVVGLMMRNGIKCARIHTT